MSQENKPFQWTQERVKELLQWLPKQPSFGADYSYLIDTFVSSHSSSEKVEKDWTITEFQHKNLPDNPEVNYISNGAGYVTKDNKSCIVKSLEWMITRPFLKIKSVKRNTDGLTFSIGDKIEQEHLSPKIITNFQISENEIIVLFENNGTFWEYLNDLIGHAKILFTTEDGKEMRQLDNYWFVQTCGIDAYTPIAATVCGKTSPSSYNSSIKKFSTEQAANEYITMNKPCLSANDVLGLDLDILVDYKGPKLPDEHVDLIIFRPESLKQLASSKIEGGK